MWTRFRKWLWKRLCPKMVITIRCGRTIDDRFFAVKRFVYKGVTPFPEIVFDLDFVPRNYEVQFGDVKLSRDEILAAIDKITSAETLEETVERLLKEDGESV